MLRTVFLAALVCACFVTSAAHARSRHGYSRNIPAALSGCSDPVMRPCDSVRAKFAHTQRTEKTHRSALRWENPTFELWPKATTRPARYIGGRLVCAVNVNAELARRGIRGTGSAAAKSFLRWGRASRPIAGAVAVYGRRGGGHVAIVSRVVNGRVYVWNPSSRSHRWREVEYRKRAIAYRVAGW